MKLMSFSPFLKAGIFSLFVLLLSCTKDSLPKENPTINKNQLDLQIMALPKEPLSEIEKNSLLLMREEEKLARDVYTTLNEKWNRRVFANITQSEQTHMNMVLLLLKKYDIPDPAAETAVGVFINNTMTKLYADLIQKGSLSLQDAFQVGMTIEDLDIFDLDNALNGEIDNKDILLVYGSLRGASTNHMRAFYRNLTGVGGSYTPQYISMSLFNEIINQ